MFFRQNFARKSIFLLPKFKNFVLGRHNEAFRWHLSAVDMRWGGISEDGTSARLLKKNLESISGI